MNLLSEHQLFRLKIEYKKIPILRANSHFASVLLQSQVSQRMPLFYCVCLQFKQYLKPLFRVSKSNSLVVRAAHVDLAQVLSHYLPVDGCDCELMAFEVMYLLMLLMLFNGENFFSLILTATYNCV